MAQTTDKQFRAYCEWMERDWNKVGKLEAYLMSIACEIRRLNTQDPKTVSINDLKLKFTVPHLKPPVDPVEESKKMKAAIFPTLFGTKFEMPPI